MNTKHTPGPWLASVRRRISMLQDLRDVLYRDLNTLEFPDGPCQLTLYRYRRVQNAIARHAVREEIDARRAAIAKAEGQS